MEDFESTSKKEAIPSTAPGHAMASDQEHHGEKSPEHHDVQAEGEEEENSVKSECLSSKSFHTIPELVQEMKFIRQDMLAIRNDMTD